MSWETVHRSFYYEDAPAHEDIVLVPAATALLVIDIQNTYLEPKPDPADDARWQPFFERMRATVIPNTARLIAACRVLVLFARGGAGCWAMAAQGVLNIAARAKGPAHSRRRRAPSHPRSTTDRADLP
jgi:hypothetical protein